MKVALLSAANGGQDLSKRLVGSYVLDWISILLTAAIGRLFKLAMPNANAFSLTDPSISYPHVDEETVSTVTLIMVSLVAPAVIILLVSLIFIPGITTEKHAAKSLVWRRKLWEWNAGWMGLGVAYAGTYAVTEGLKVAFGKPRPDMLSRCHPDLASVATYAVGGLGAQIKDGPVIVKSTICQATSIRDGFVSFPSGHSSMSFAGLTFLTLWLCAKLFVAIPHLPPRPFTRARHLAAFSSGMLPPPNGDPYIRSQEDGSGVPRVPLRNQAAAPPAYLVLILSVPLAAATYIAASRWFDYRHFGFDILFGSILGALFAWFGFRLYNPPISSGGGWAWSARSPELAFFSGVGHTSYIVDNDGWSSGWYPRPTSSTGVYNRTGGTPTAVDGPMEA